MNGIGTTFGTQNEQKNKLDDFPLASFVSASLALHGLRLTVEDRDAVMESARSIADAHALVRSFPLPEDMDAASIFTA